MYMFVLKDIFVIQMPGGLFSEADRGCFHY